MVADNTIAWAAIALATPWVLFWVTYGYLTKQRVKKEILNAAQKGNHERAAKLYHDLYEDEQQSGFALREGP